MQVCQASATDSMDAFVFILAHAERLLESRLEFTPSELHAAVEQLKGRLPKGARRARLLADISFAKHTISPYSSSLERCISSLAAAGIHLPTLGMGGRLRVYYRLGQEEAKWARDEYQFGPDDIALLGPLVPLFAMCLNTIIAQRGDSKQ